MTKLFFDTEFTGLHQATTLISIGLISECGKTFYAELTDYEKNQVDNWIEKNVIENLFLGDESDLQGAKETWCTGDQTWYIGNKDGLKDELQKWLSQFGTAEMWADHISYDWVLFCDIFGHAFNIPKNVHYIPYDLCTLLMVKGYDPDLNREQFTGVKTGVKHNALHDAKVIKACYERVMSK